MPSSRATILALFLSGVALAGDEPAAPPKPPKFGPAPAGLAIELKSPRAVYGPGEPIRVDATLVNRSKSAVPVVVPDFGSESGVREPFVSWLAWSVGADGAETPLVPHGVRRCGTGMNPDWRTSVVTLAAGQKTGLSKLEAPTNTFDFQDAGRVRLRLRYAYGAGFHGSDWPKADGPADGTKGSGDASTAKPPGDATGAMGAQAPFELLSEPLDVRIERPIDLVVEVTGPPAPGVAKSIGEFVRVKAVSTDAAAHPLRASEWTLSFEFSDLGALQLDCPESWPPAALARDAEVPAGGSVPLVPGAKFTCKASGAGTCKVRAVLASTAEEGGPRIVSAWSALTFKP